MNSADWPLGGQRIGASKNIRKNTSLILVTPIKSLSQPFIFGHKNKLLAV